MIRRQWVRRLTDPDEPLTLEEFKAVPAALLLREQPLIDFVGPLNTAIEEKRAMTMLDAIFIALVHLRENAKDARLGTQHLEGMVGTLDEFLAGTNEQYRGLVGKRAKTAPMIPGAPMEAP